MVRKIGWLVVSILLLVIGLEAGTRILGFEPYRLPEFYFESNPNPCFGKDSLGVTLIPGQYSVNLNGLVHQVGHSVDCNRVTSFETSGIEGRNKVFIYGCSYTYGQGINDQFTYPFLLQKQFQQMEFVNFSRPGYGTLQTLLQLRSSIEQDSKPNVVVVGFADFHEERNVLATSYKYKLYQGYKLMSVSEDIMVYPRLNYTGDSHTVEYENITKSFEPMPLRKYSAFMNMVDLRLAFSALDKLEELKASEVIIQEISSLCISNDIDLIVANLDDASNMSAMRNICKKHEVKYVNVSPDFRQEGYRNLPYDNHPNAEAHKVYTDKLAAFFTSNLDLK